MLDPRSCRKLVVYGGSFDPPHRAHTELPFTAARQVAADGVLFVPAGHPPHKPQGPVAAAHHRLAMLKLALGDRPDAAISTCEIDKPNLSYTVDTLEELRRELPGVELRLLIGADMAAMFDQWHRPQRVVQLAEPLVMMRTGHCNLDARWRDRLVSVPPIDISSSQIRQLISRNQWADPRLTANLAPIVVRYIREHGLYQNNSQSA